MTKKILITSQKSIIVIFMLSFQQCNNQKVLKAIKLKILFEYSSSNYIIKLSE